MISTCYSAILEYIGANWTTTPIHYPNTKQPVVSPYVRVTFLPAGSVQAEIGEPGMARHDGIMQLDVFVDVDTGEGLAAQYADDLKTLFTRGTRLTKNGLQVTFAEPSPLAGRDDGHGYYQVPLQCPWYVFYSN